MLKFSQCVRGATAIALAFVGLVAIGGPALAAPGDVTTFAGSGVSGKADGTGVAASFFNPEGLVTDAAGNIFVADTSNNLIRKITPAGVVTTFAGSGLKKSVDGTGIAASFNGPTEIAIDSSGTLYVADRFGNVIRKISVAGVVTTLAGSGVQGNKDGLGLAATFNGPHGLAFDGSGSLFVADSFNNLIRKITPGGLVSTFAGSGASGYVDAAGTSAAFGRPSSLAIDAANNVYVGDILNHVIRRITPAGVVTTFAGNGTTAGSGGIDGPGISATFGNPFGLAFDLSGNLVVADNFSGKIRSLTPAGIVSTLSGPLAGVLISPIGITVNAAGTIYVADEGSQTIVKIEGGVLSSGSSTTTITSSTTTTTVMPVVATSTTLIGAISTTVASTSTTTTSTAVALVFPTIPVPATLAIVSPVSVAPTTTVATSLAPPTTAPAPSPTLTVAALVQQSSIPQSVVDGPSVEGVSATATPAYTGSATTATLMFAMAMLAIGAALLMLRSIHSNKSRQVDKAKFHQK
jgi:hypothetical protein